jgi:hypothetical protein
MSATLTDKTGFSRDAVVALSEMKQEPTWLRDARLRAWDTYESIPMPARTDEEWRRTDFRALKLGLLTPFSPNGHKEPSLEALLSGFENNGVAEGRRHGMVGSESRPRGQGRHLLRSRYRRPRT